MKNSNVKRLEEEALGYLNGQDRIRLYIKAHAEGDQGAAERLLNTRPKGYARGRDLDLHRTLALSAIRAGEGIYDRSSYALEMLGRVERLLEEMEGKGKSILARDLLWVLRWGILYDFRPAWAAYDKFCREKYDLSGAEVISAFQEWEGPPADLDRLINEELELPEENREYIEAETARQKEELEKQSSKLEASFRERTRAR